MMNVASSLLLSLLLSLSIFSPSSSAGHGPGSLRDISPALKKYLEYFRINAVGLTGTKAEIDNVVRRYGARYEIEQSDSAAGYHINHSTDLYLIDEKGEVAHRFSYSDGAQVIAEGVRRLQEEQSDERREKGNN
jgi:hypothetical protein